jgi:radical SAM superfamily enzyme
MPLDNPSLMGTEKDGSKSEEYCVYCYQNGAFLNPGMSLEEMKRLVKEQMQKMKIDETTISMAVSSLPFLKRWKATSTAV